MTLSDAGLATMISEIAPGAATQQVRPIGGGLAAATFAVDTSAGDFVLKVYRPADDTPSLEWERLTFAQRAGVPVPEPVALDAEGRWFGSAALVMSRLPGRADVRPTDPDGWLRQLAHALAAVHETDTTGASGPLLRPSLADRELQDTDVGIRSALVDRCVEAIRRHHPGPAKSAVLMHGDFHPGNIVWSRGRLTGVVDWSAARLGSRWFELAYCRADVALLRGMRGARRLATHYVEIAGAPPVDLPVYDLMCGLAARRLAVAQWLRSYRQQGCTDTARQFTARVTPFLRQALAELGA